MTQQGLSPCQRSCTPPCERFNGVWRHLAAPFGRRYVLQLERVWYVRALGVWAPQRGAASLPPHTCGPRLEPSPGALRPHPPPVRQARWQLIAARIPSPVRSFCRRALPNAGACQHGSRGIALRWTFSPAARPPASVQRTSLRRRLTASLAYGCPLVRGARLARTTSSLPPHVPLVI